jgi:hypothetical protein
MMYPQVSVRIRLIVAPLSSASAWQASHCLLLSSVPCWRSVLAKDAAEIQKSVVLACSSVVLAAVEPGGLADGFVVATGVAVDVVVLVRTGIVAEPGRDVHIGCGRCPLTESWGQTERLKSLPLWWECDIGSRLVVAAVLTFHAPLTVRDIPATHLLAISSLVRLARPMILTQAPFPSYQEVVVLPAVFLNEDAMTATCVHHGSSMASGQMENLGETVTDPGLLTRSESWSVQTCVLDVQLEGGQ